MKNVPWPVHKRALRSALLYATIMATAWALSPFDSAPTTGDQGWRIIVAVWIAAFIANWSGQVEGVKRAVKYLTTRAK